MGMHCSTPDTMRALTSVSSSASLGCSIEIDPEPSLSLADSELNRPLTKVRLSVTAHGRVDSSKLGLCSRLPSSIQHLARSKRQCRSQPSAFVKLPSSHSSGFWRVPSPHCGRGDCSAAEDASSVDGSSAVDSLLSESWLPEGDPSESCSLE